MSTYHSDEDKEVMRAIGHYFMKVDSVELVGEESYIMAVAAIENLQITNIKKEQNNIIIHLGRPGHLIGVRGKKITDLEEYLKKALNNPELKIKLV